MNVIFDNTIGETPAMIDRSKGDLFINPGRFFPLSEDHQRVILSHELGHYYQQTASEVHADNYSMHRSDEARMDPVEVFWIYRDLLYPVLERIINIADQAAKKLDINNNREMERNKVKQIKRKFQNQQASVFQPKISGVQKYTLDPLDDLFRKAAGLPPKEPAITEPQQAGSATPAIAQQQQQPGNFKKFIPWVVGIAVLGVATFFIIKKK
jgi:hypothetical protein